MSTRLDPLQKPATGRRRVLKFGGTSVGGADRLREIVRLTREALLEDRVLLVASAMSGVTNLLLEAARQATGGDATGAEAFAARHREVLGALGPDLTAPHREALARRLEGLAAELSKLLQGIALLGRCPPPTLARLSAFGEEASCALLAGLLEAQGIPCLALDPRKVLPCSGNPLEATPDLGAMRAALAPFREGGEPLALLPGFFGGDAQGEVVLLGRGGSDLSAALAAAALDAHLLEIWTDVDGIFTADPRLVPEAACLDALSYEEAMELAHFGAKVLHPRTLAPLRDQRIPVRVRNTFRPGHPGTLVEPVPSSSRTGARGLSLLQDVTLLDVAGPGMRGVPGVAARAFGALAALEISVILITQGSSECALTLCVKTADAETAAAALARAFEAEQAAGMVDPVGVRGDLCILSLVGDGMRDHPGVAGAFFEALGRARCNVAAIAQGSSERSISAVLAAADGARGMEAVHDRFFREGPLLEVYLLGVGLVGAQFLVQLRRQQARLRASGVTLRLCGAATSRSMVLDPKGLDPEAVPQALDHRGQPLDLARLAEHLAQRSAHTRVVVDCTSSEAVTNAYAALAATGCHLVTANKKLCSGPLARRDAVAAALAQRGGRLLFETNVGAGLPVIATLRDLEAGGDVVTRVEGLLSGSLSFLLGLLEDGVPFSQALRQAMDAGFTEPDPRDDLSGLDVARKALILHRELGGRLELEDVSIEGVLPRDFPAEGPLADVLARVPDLDAVFAERCARLAAEGKVLRYGAVATPTACQAGFLEVPRDHPLAAVRGGENALSFHTEGYHPCPLVIRGYGAGAKVTAAGVLADVMRLIPGGGR